MQRDTQSAAAANAIDAAIAQLQQAKQIALSKYDGDEWHDVDESIALAFSKLAAVDYDVVALAQQAYDLL